MAGAAEGVAGEHVADRGEGFVLGLRHDHALARGEAVGLHDDRCALRTHPGLGLGEVLEGAVRGGRDPVTGQEVLAEGLRTLEPGRCRGRAEAGESGRREAVDDAGHERRLGPDDGELDGPLAREGEQTVEIVHGDGDVVDAGQRFRAGVARGDVDALDAGALRGLPGERVFASAAADDEDLHGSGLLSGGNGACR